MNYRHAFHAGNFADVFKHAILVGLIHALKAKPTPFCYIDTHAGAGKYDFRDEEARKTGEHVDGVQRLLIAAVVARCIARRISICVRAANSADANGHLHVYPGSPLIASLLMRATRSRRALRIAARRSGETAKRCSPATRASACISATVMPRSKGWCRRRNAAAWC